MLIFTTRLQSQPAKAAAFVLELDHEQRRRSRLVITLLDDTQVGIALPRGTPLCPGDWLATHSGQLALIQAANEVLSVAETADHYTLLRAAYHLGNRHTALQLEAERLYYPHDHVLDQLCMKLGLAVSLANRPFFPEVLLAAHEHHTKVDSVATRPSTATTSELP